MYKVIKFLNYPKSTLFRLVSLFLKYVKVKQQQQNKQKNNRIDLLTQKEFQTERATQTFFRPNWWFEGKVP